MKFIKVIKSKNIKSKFTDNDLDKVQEIVNNIITESDLPMNIDRKNDYLQVFIDADNYYGNDNFEKIQNEFEDIIVEIKIKLLQEFRSKVQFNPLYGDSVGISIRSGF